MARNALMPQMQLYDAPQGPNVGNFINPLMAGIQRGDTLRQQGFQNERALTAEARQGEQLQLAKNADTRAGEDQAFQRDDRMRKQVGGLALAVINDPDKARAATNWQKWVTAHPQLGETLTKHGQNPADWYSSASFIAAQAGVMPDPLERERGTLQNKVLRRQLEQPLDDGSKIIEVNGQIVRVPRQGDGVSVYSAPPKPTPPQIKEVNGKLVSVSPDGKTATEIYGGSEAEVGAKIIGSLNELGTIPQRYDSFNDAVGSFQGGDIPIVSNLARGVGSVASTFSKTSPSEVRRAIDGTSETLASTIKALIRKPGEGTWTDADQKRLDYIIGDLKKANNVKEYDRGLEEVRRRVEASFGIKLPPLSLPARDKVQGKLSDDQPPMAGAKKAGDGKWYVADPNRPGKYLMVQP